MPSPRVTAHFAQSLDGKIALEHGRAVWSNEAGLRRAHEARRDHDAVLVGVETVRIDNPRLSVRACEGAQPARVVVSSTLALPLESRLFQDRGDAKIYVIGATGRATPERQRAIVEKDAEAILVQSTSEGLVSLPHALAALRERGVVSLLVEGGARILTAFFRQQLVHRAEIELAPKLLGAPHLSAIGPLGFYSLAQSISLSEIQTEQLGDNLLVSGNVVYASP